MDNEQRNEASPQNFEANQFVITFNTREIGLVLGQSRHVIDAITGRPEKQRTEWHASYSLSAVTAQQIHGALSEILQRYEEQFGRIPVDPMARIAHSDKYPVEG